ncbi:hypothetical protein [Actinokineospora enzanensis]|uniref:hypothetical protein n=1 Tax=Actinokineospora enzanensis TaxID=155975 RepID=UPI0003792595|nr:hypothetical protein [Actinokineospora enzanensis]
MFANDERGVEVPLARLAHEMVRDLCPEQLDRLDEVTDRYERGSRWRVPWSRGGSVGSGVEPSLFVDIVYPLLIGLVTQLSGAVVVVRYQEHRQRRRKVRPSTAIWVQQAAVPQVRGELVRQCLEQGMSPEDAERAAVAVCRHLIAAIVEAEADGRANT